MSRVFEKLPRKHILCYVVGYACFTIDSGTTIYGFTEHGCVECRYIKFIANVGWKYQDNGSGNALGVMEVAMPWV